MEKIQKAFRLKTETVTELEKLSERWGTNQTATIETAIHNAFINASNTDEKLDTDSTLASKLIDTLSNQITVKDKQIDDLNETVTDLRILNREQAATIAQLGESAAQALLNAQTLNAADKSPAMLEQARPSRMARFKKWLGIGQSKGE